MNTQKMGFEPVGTRLQVLPERSDGGLGHVEVIVMHSGSSFGCHQALAGCLAGSSERAEVRQKRSGNSAGCGRIPAEHSGRGLRRARELPGYAGTSMECPQAASNGSESDNANGALSAEADLPNPKS